MARKQAPNRVSPLRLGVAALLAGALVGVLGGAFLLTLRQLDAWRQQLSEIGAAGPIPGWLHDPRPVSPEGR